MLRKLMRINGSLARTVPRMTTRQAAQRREMRRHTAPRPAVRHIVRRTTRTVTARPRLALNSRERHIVYQTIVEREVLPRQQVIVAHPPVLAPTPSFVQPQAVVPVNPPIVAADETVQPAAPVYTTGSVLPENVPLYAIPQNVALSVPAAQAHTTPIWAGALIWWTRPMGRSWPT